MGPYGEFQVLKLGIRFFRKSSPSEEAHSECPKSIHSWISVAAGISIDVCIDALPELWLSSNITEPHFFRRNGDTKPQQVIRWIQNDGYLG